MAGDPLESWVAEVAFSGFTRDGLLRHAIFLGLREDKAASDVVLQEWQRTPGARAVEVVFPEAFIENGLWQSAVESNDSVVPHKTGGLRCIPHSLAAQFWRACF